MIKNFLVLFALFFIALGCSNKDLYNSLQPDGSSCRKLTTPQRAECEKKISKQMTYDEYQKERKKL